MNTEGNAAEARAMFGDYEIIETVGQGGMGVVYRAHDVSLGRVVALKVLKDDLRSNAQICARFQREAEAFASLNHPNIVHIYSVGAVGNIPFISMEFIEGGPLSRIMKKEKRILWKRAFHLAEQISEALACAHDSHIIHRDIKPGNIMVDESDHAFVTDFGIAKILTAETQLTVAGSRLGTPQYMSPERCQDREITGSSDIYSLGVLLFQMITGRLPYEASSPVDLIRKIVTDAPSRVSQYRTDVPEDVERLVAFSIEKKPHDRPQSAHEFAELLRRVRAGEPLSEDTSGIAESLESLRGTIATPMPSNTPPGVPATGPLRVFRTMARRWGSLSEAVRVTTVGVVIIAVAALSGFQIAKVLNRGYAVDTVRSMSSNMQSWNRSSVVADFFDESAGVLLARINMPSGHHVVDATFLESGAVALLMEDAQGLSSTLCIVDPTERSSRMSISPKTQIGSARAFHVAGSAGSLGNVGSYPNGYFFTRDISGNGDAPVPGLFLSSMGPDAKRETRLLFKGSDLDGVGGVGIPVSIGSACVSPAGDAIIMTVASAIDSDSWSLLAYNPQGTEVLDSVGATIAWIDTARGDPLVRYLRQEDDAFQLWTVDASDATSQNMIYEGTGGVSRSAMDATGRYLVATREAESGSALGLIDLNDAGADPIEVGAGTSAAWHPSGDFFVATASDRKGHSQLWAVRPYEPYRRAQLTFLADGTGTTCQISPDGMWAVTSAPNAPVTVFVDVSADALVTLDF